MCEAMHVENRMVRLGQLVQGEHSENSGEGCAENCELKGDGNERRPAIERAAANVDGKGGISIKTAIARLADFFHGMNELLGRLKLAHHAVYVGAVQHYLSSSEVSATSSRISAMEIAGRTRTKRKIRVTNMPMVPMNVAQSQNVGL